MLLFGRRKWVQQVLWQLICILSNGRRNSTQQQEGCDTFTLSEALVSWASSSSLCLFLSPLSFLPSGASVHPSGSVWKTVGLELCDCYNFHLTPHPTPSRLLSKATCFCFCFFLWFSPPPHREVSGLHWLDCHGNLILGNLLLSKKTQQCLWVTFVRYMHVYMVHVGVTSAHRQSENQSLHDRIFWTINGLTPV